MTIKERLAEAKANLEAVKMAVEAGEKTAEELEAAIEEVKGAQESVKAAEEAEQMIKSLGTTQNTEEEEEIMEFKSVGEHAAHAFKESGNDAKSRFNYTTPEFKAAAPMTTPSSISPAITDVDKRIVEGFRRPLMIADLFSAETISGSALTYFVESSTVEGGPSATSEGAEKPMMSFGNPTAVTKALAKIASYMKESSELIEDAPWLADAINGRGMYQHELAVENYLLTQLAGTSGIGTSSTLTADGIFGAMTTVLTTSGFAADAIIINPTDYQTLRLAKDSNDQYYGGGYFYAPYGNNGVIENPPIWGLRTVVTPAVTQGTAYVGAFKMGGSVVRKNGVTVNIANMNEDDFIKNMVTILIEERLALAVRRPACFVKITSSDTDTE